MQYLEEIKPALYAQRIERTKIVSSKDANSVIRQIYGIDPSTTELAEPSYEMRSKEVIGVLWLDTGNLTIGYTILGHGNMTSTPMDHQGMIATACKLRANKAIMFHNHPSGRAIPSESDRYVTALAGALLFMANTTLVDHLIVTEQSYYSFGDQGESYLINSENLKKINIQNLGDLAKAIRYA